MKIATMVKGYITAPPPNDIVYAPYDLALDLSDELVSRGHTVDFFAPVGSHSQKTNIETLGLEPLVHSKAEFDEACRNIGYHLDNILALWDQYLAAEMFRRAQAGQYDLLHFHHPEVALPYVRDYPSVPVVYTMHDPIEPIQQQILRMHESPNQSVVSISNNQRLAAPDLPYIATVYNGIDTNLFTYQEQQYEDYLVYIGRIVPEKGAREAVEVARHTNSRLLIIGPTFPDHQNYFDDYIKPYLNDKIQYLGHIDRAQLVPYFQAAKALLAPIQWEEPFGLTMIEALACGTPVIAFRRGSVSEIIDPGHTGFIVDDVPGMIAAVQKLSHLSPAQCRTSVLQRFSVTKMVDGYEVAYKAVLARAKGVS